MTDTKKPIISYKPRAEVKPHSKSPAKSHSKSYDKPKTAVRKNISEAASVAPKRSQLATSTSAQPREKVRGKTEADYAAERKAAREAKILASGGELPFKRRLPGGEFAKPRKLSPYQEKEAKQKAKAHENKVLNDAHIKNPRDIAVIILLDVIKGRSLTDALAKGLQNANSNDKPFIQHLLYGTLRQYEAINDHLTQLLSTPIASSEPKISAVLILSLFEALYMQTAEYALVNQWVNLVKFYKKEWAANLVNAVLRRVLREGRPEIKSQAGKANLPLWLLQILKKDYPEEYLNIAKAYSYHPSFVLRVNIHKINRQDYLAELSDAGIKAIAHPYVETAIILEEAIPVTKLPKFAEGLVSVQDASAQMAAVLLAPKRGETILDACAAPGGKTGHLWECAPEAKKLVALELEEHRCLRIHENIDRIALNATNIEIVVSDLLNYEASQQFDAILLDAPCSATGIIHRHPDIKLLRKPEDIEALCELQAKLLDKCFELLKPQGRLLYATCSILKAENEIQMTKFLEKYQDKILEIKLDLGFGLAQKHGVQIIPKQDNEAIFDGFYYCLMSKN